MEALIALAIIFTGIYALTRLFRAATRALSSRRIVRAFSQAGTQLQTSFLLAPCTRCDENTMEILSISPNARSLKYRCHHCGRGGHAKAANTNASKCAKQWFRASDLLQRFNRKYQNRQLNLMALVDTQFAPASWEQTTREPINKALKSEIWRRDQGSCVECGAQNNLHFDHIIPVSKGGGTIAQNLQLLCQSCNLSKGASI